MPGGSILRKITGRGYGDCSVPAPESTRQHFPFERISAPAWSSRSDGSPEYFNRPWLDFTGLSPQEALGGELREGLYPEDLPRPPPRPSGARVRAGRRDLTGPGLRLIHCGGQPG